MILARPHIRGKHLLVTMQPGWLFLSLAVSGGILWRSDLTHFTWWQLIQFAFYCALAAFNKHERYVLAFVSQALLTIVGVVAMVAGAVLVWLVLPWLLLVVAWLVGWFVGLLAGWLVGLMVAW